VFKPARGLASTGGISQLQPPSIGVAMEAPEIKSVLLDRDRNVRYEVYAYRILNEDELVMTVRLFLSSQKRKPKRNSQVEIYTIIGDTR
jgi:hypothetical protein